MKTFLLSLLFLLSFNAFADNEIYSGNNKGASCLFELNIENKYAFLNNCGVFATKNFVNNGKIVTLEGGAEFTDCKIEVTLNSSKVPVSATLSTKHLLKPFYTKVAVCTDLKRIR